MSNNYTHSVEYQSHLIRREYKKKIEKLQVERDKKIQQLEKEKR